MKIHKEPSNVIITFSPEDYWLKKSDDDFNGTYMLVVRIDMSYAGKPDQEGATVLYLDDTEAQKFRECGFDEIL